MFLTSARTAAVPLNRSIPCVWISGGSSRITGLPNMASTSRVAGVLRAFGFVAHHRPVHIGEDSTKIFMPPPAMMTAADGAQRPHCGTGGVTCALFCKWPRNGSQTGFGPHGLKPSGGTSSLSFSWLFSSPLVAYQPCLKLQLPYSAWPCSARWMRKRKCLFSWLP